MKRSGWGAVALALGMVCPAQAQESGGRVAVGPETTAAEPATEVDSTAWLINSLSDSFTVAEGATLRFVHAWGDVRVEAGETDRVHVTALAQYHQDDPRAASIRVSDGDSVRQLVVEFAHLEIAEDGAWANRRIDVGLLVPRGLEIDIETDRGIIEVKKLEAPGRLTSDRGDIVYDGTGSVSARTERGSLRALLRQTGDGRSADLSSLTGDIWCVLLEGAQADVTLETRGTVTTDYSVEIDREAGSPLKKGRLRIGEGGAAITLTSHSGGVRLQSLIVPEEGDPLRKKR